MPNKMAKKTKKTMSLTSTIPKTWRRKAYDAFRLRVMIRSTFLMARETFTICKVSSLAPQETKKSKRVRRNRRSEQK